MAKDTKKGSEKNKRIKLNVFKLKLYKHIFI